jgi:regulator of CtrA degradation
MNIQVSNETAGPVAFFSRTYDETVGLLYEVKSYVTEVQNREAEAYGLAGKAIATQETTRLIARLTQVMAWLLVRKAVHVGEISRSEALDPRHRLGGHSVCLDEGNALAMMPESRLAMLMDRSRRLYVRVSRLDEMLERGAI